MRRSSAPSMRRGVNIQNQKKKDSIVPTQPAFNSLNSVKSGSCAESYISDNDSSDRIGELHELESGSNPLSGKRVFRVVWRNITTKKHKTWNGDGTLEVTIERAVLKDDTGKYMGSLNNLKPCDLEPDLQLTIGGKEIELQDEIKTAEEYWAHHKQQMSNRAWGEEDYAREEGETKKPKGNFVFRPILHLDKPQVALTPLQQFRQTTVSKITVNNARWNDKNITERTKRPLTSQFNQPQQHTRSVDANSKSETIFWGTKKRRVSLELLNPQISETFTSANEVCSEVDSKIQKDNEEIVPESKTDYICLLQPSELQYTVLSKCYELYTKQSKIIFEENTPAAILDICQSICDHPTLLQQYDNQDTYLIQQILQELPDWSEMGPYDSAKFEFTQTLLNRFSLDKREKCVIVVNDPETIVILRGYCEYVNLNSLIIDENTCSTNYARLIKRFNEPANEDCDRLLVALIQSSVQLEEVMLGDVKRLIFYNSVPNSNIRKMISSLNNLCVYHLITAGCFEEHKFLRQLKEPSFIINDASEYNVSELIKVELDSTACLTQEAMVCNNEGVDIAPKEDLMSKLTNWEHCKPPFSASFLKSSCLSDEDPNLKFVIYKTNFFKC